MQIDEAMSLLGAMQWRHGFQDVHPPFYYAWLELWSQVSFSEWWLRSSSVMASLLSLVLWIRLLRHWRPELVFACIFMLVTSFCDIQQAREVRMYVWLEFWVLAYLCAFLENKGRLAALALAAACFTHLFGLFLIPLSLLTAKLQGVSAWSRWNTAVLALWLAWGIPHYWGQRQHPLSLRQRPDLMMAIEAIGRLLSGRVAAFGDNFSIILGGLTLLWIFWRRPACPRLIYFWAFFPWVTIWLVSRLTPLQMFEFKYLAWTLPAWIYLLAASIAPRFLLPAWSVLNLVGVLPWLLYPHQWQADWRGVAQYVQDQPLTIYVHPSMMAAPLLYYGLSSPHLQLVDEWEQLQPAAGKDLIWVTTLNHPYVIQQRLRLGLEKFWHLEKERNFTSQLPSSEIRVGFWHWQQALPRPEEKQER